MIADAAKTVEFAKRLLGDPLLVAAFNPAVKIGDAVAQVEGDGRADRAQTLDQRRARRARYTGAIRAALGRIRNRISGARLAGEGDYIG